MAKQPNPLLSAFEAGDIPNGGFSHADHIAAAFAILNKYDFVEATSRYAGNIRTMAARAGAPEKFNVTITIAFMSLIAERMRQANYRDVDDFAARNPDLMTKDVLAGFYSPERLSSKLARTVFLLPDAPKSPLPVTL